MQPHWKNTAEDLRSRALHVTSEVAAAMSPLTPASRIDARTAAKVLAGIVGHVARTWTVDIMQTACAVLARHEPTWDLSRPNLVALPIENDGSVTEPVKLIALVAHGLLPLAGAANVRNALAFWATEDDPGVWTRIVES